MSEEEKYNTLFDKILDSSLCPKCGSDVLVDQAFCSKCGNTNPDFSEDRYKEMIGETYEEAVKRSCVQLEHSGHLSDSLESKEATKFYKDHPFCSECGKKIALPE